MNPSPGHEKWPHHKVEEKPFGSRVKVEIQGETVADTEHAIVVEEDGYPPRFYIPQSDIDMDKLSKSNTPAKCPFKGEGHYYSVHVENDLLEDVAWTYGAPYDEHKALQQRVAFHDEMPAVQLLIQ